MGDDHAINIHYAMQVLSRTVGDALLHYNEEDTIETARFVKMFDRFFDMLNTRSLKEHIFQRKPDLSPYRTPDDTRLQVSTCSYYVQNLIINN